MSFAEEKSAVEDTFSTICLTDEECEDEKTDSMGAMASIVPDFSGASHRRSTLIKARSVRISTKDWAPASRKLHRRTTEEVAAEKERRHLLDELVETEESYLVGLRQLLYDLILPLFTRKLVAAELKPKLTLNIGTMIAFHELFCAEMKETRQSDATKTMAQVFNEKADFLKMYTVYVKEYNSLMDLISQLTARSKAVKRHFASKRKAGLQLANLLILPIQRVPRYLLLLESVLKHTAVGHSERGDLQSAVAKVLSISEFINERQREIENMSQCLQVQSKLKDLSLSIVEPHRKFVDDFVFWCQKRKRQRNFFLFSDLVIIANGSWKVKAVHELRTLDVKKGTDATFTLYSKVVRSTRYSFESEEDFDAFYRGFANERSKVWAGDVSRLSCSGNVILQELIRAKATVPLHSLRVSTKEKGGALLARMRAVSDLSAIG